VEDFSLAVSDFSETPVKLTDDLLAFEQEAMMQRPELFQQDLQERISADDARLAIAQMFPSPALFLRYQHDRNKFLRHKTWTTVGARASWDLLSIPRQVFEHRAARRRVTYVRDRRVLLAVAILSQVHLAAIEYEEAIETHRLVRGLSDTRQQYLDVVRNRQQQGEVGADAVLDAETKQLFARVRYMSAYAEVMTAYARLCNSLGRDRLMMAPTETPEAPEKPKTAFSAITKLAGQAVKMPLKLFKLPQKAVEVPMGHLVNLTKLLERMGKPAEKPTKKTPKAKVKPQKPAAKAVPKPAPAPTKKVEPQAPAPTSKAAVKPKEQKKPSALLRPKAWLSGGEAEKDSNRTKQKAKTEEPAAER